LSRYDLVNPLMRISNHKVKTVFPFLQTKVRRNNTAL